MKSNYIEENLDKLKSTWLIEEKILDKWEMLFDIWDIDNNLYYILDGNLWVNIESVNNRREIAILSKWDITWEASLLWINIEKKASIIAKTKTKLISFNIEKKLDLLFKAHPMIAKWLFVYLLWIEHERVKNLNFHVSANYDINNLIRDIWEINMKSIFKVIDWFKEIIKADRVLFIERNENVDDIIMVSYDTNFPWRKQTDKFYDKENSSKIIKLWEIYSDNNIDEENQNIYINDISIWKFILGYFIVIRNNEAFTDNDQKVISWITNSFWWLLKQYKYQKDEINIAYINNY